MVNNASVLCSPYCAQNLQLQIETRDQAIMALKSQLEGHRLVEIPHRDTDPMVS